MVSRESCSAALPFALVSRRLCSFVFVAGLLLALAVPAWPLDTSPADIARTPERFDGKVVTLTGKVTNLQTRVSQKGNPYFTFDLSDGAQAVRVFSYGPPPCPAGATATIEGRFQRVKRVGRYTFYNEIDATTVACR
ncbi:MAG: hypothetical protein HY727_09620 [Candidatus Rokubacteria bacterium]|nr:hypothetical protein [Candidatus Rokubacteria bacterium]